MRLRQFILALAGTCVFLATSCSSPTGTGALLGAATGAGAGYVYDRTQNDHPNDPNYRTRMTRMAKGAGIGAAAGAGIGYLSGRAATNQQLQTSYGYNQPQPQQQPYYGNQPYRQPVTQQAPYGY